MGAVARGCREGFGLPYRWRQDIDDFEVSVGLPEAAVKNQLKVTTTSKRLRVEYAGKVLVDGQFAGACSPDGSTWTISEGTCVLFLEKATPGLWPSLLCGEVLRDEVMEAPPDAHPGMGGVQAA